MMSLFIMLLPDVCVQVYNTRLGALDAQEQQAVINRDQALV